MWGIIAITRDGLTLAKRLKRLFPESMIYTLPKWSDADTEIIEGELSAFSGTLFERHRTLVYIMASGIVLRSIAQHISDKTTDPAVVVINEQGTFVISLLSGHLGGANEVAKLIAGKINALPIITTASDGQGLPSVDMIAQKHNLIIESMSDAKTITAMAVNGNKIALQNDSFLVFPEYYPHNAEVAEGLVVISNRQSIHVNLPYARLIPQNITVGVGCKRGTPGTSLITFITELLDVGNIHPKSVSQLASVDIKSDEQGILDAAAHFGVNAVFVPAAEIELVESQFTSSAFVKSQIGVSGVCEPAAFIAGGREGKFISQKQSKDGITVAIFESAR